ncbi:putative ubl carboxyl-terminal hydrolase 18-like isoform 2 [Scophthalmus maximus]|uniref:Putative ubl carboxyl-terminal hydrolase 18-like isoform 2 n=1 Tax=Scophthalmus maximus TaxID=52904 RepID=A0A2U9B2W2_SCOMX|nr:putative ubl carboxyl-terminal hydrolase 18-like isoform 2 [Scophthalmus maximus]
MYTHKSDAARNESDPGVTSTVVGVQDESDRRLQLVKRSRDLMSSRFRRFLSSIRWSDLEQEMRGLSNYRLSCCVNTLLQTLSATWEVSDLLEKWEAAGVRADSHNVPLQLKRVLAAMRSDHLPQHVPHRDFLHCLDRNCVRLSVQHDADEVFLSILNFVQQQMDDRALALEIQNLYKISVETHLQCLECDSVQTRTSYLLSLHLHLKEDHNSLAGCISSFLEDQELRGIDRCFCAKCGIKTPSKQGVKLLSLPRILCVHLKRFRNSRGYTRKLDCQVTFPETFDFSEIAREGFATDFAQNECKYTLYAVVVHSGSAMCGHYTAYVRHRGNQGWYYADDSFIRQASWEDVQRTNGKYNSTTAYMLMYRRGAKEEGQQPELSG